MDATASEVARLVRSRELSATDVVEAHLHRTEAVGPAINAVVALDAEGALAARPWRDDVAPAATAALETALGGWRAPRL